MSEKVTKKAKSDTPRTDAAWADTGTNIFEFARQLEQELNAMTQCALSEGVRSGRVQAVAEQLATAASTHLERYVALVNSGDAGNWNPETEAHVVALRQALAELEKLKGKQP